MSVIRVEVEHAGRGGHIVYVDPICLDRLTPARRAKLDEILERALAEAAEVVGQDARDVLVALLVERIAEERAYERACARRGVLPL